MWWLALGAALGCAVAALFVAMVLRAVSQPQIDERQTSLVHMSEVAVACKEYQRLTGNWPSDLSQVRMAIPVRSPAVFIDGWGRQLILVANTNAPNTIWIESHGADGLPGGEGSNADIVTQLR